MDMDKQIFGVEIHKDIGNNRPVTSDAITIKQRYVF